MDKRINIERNLQLVDQAAACRPGFILLSELSTTPYFCGDYQMDYFDWAEPIPGETTRLFGQKAKEIGSHIILPIFERTAEKQFYNSAVLIGPDGETIPGILPGGGRVPAYRKVHIPASVDFETNILRSNEKFYFSPGPGFCVFNTTAGVVGILICWDKRFFEGWRSLALQGAEIIFNPIATWGRWREETFGLELCIMAMNNQVAVVGVGKAGTESLGYQRDFTGGSFIVDPWGRIIAGAEAEEGKITEAEIDLGEIEKARASTPMYRDRRPELYGLLSKIV
jgi:N-carbamoylputrescine amidase